MPFFFALCFTVFAIGMVLLYFFAVKPEGTEATVGELLELCQVPLLDCYIVLCLELLRKVKLQRPSTTGGSCSTALTLTSGRTHPSPNDLLLLDTQGRVFCGLSQSRNLCASIGSFELQFKLVISAHDGH